MAIVFIQWMTRERETKLIDFKSDKEIKKYIYIKNGAVVQFKNRLSNLMLWNAKRIDLFNKLQVNNIMICYIK